MEFKGFPKLARLSRDVIITEKLDGTNSSILIQSIALEDSNFLNHFKSSRHLTDSVISEIDGFTIRAGSRTRWITPDDDNYGFARWVKENASELVKLGEGHHFGEWWGSGIQRGYNLPRGEKRYSLFNAGRWRVNSFDEKGFECPPKCCSVVPVLYTGIFDTNMIQDTMNDLIENGSYASPGFMNPEGIVIYHIAGNLGFKKTIKNDDRPKSLSE
jgi:hypothetical protein